MPNKYEHDTERWLRSQASLYRACHNRDLAEKFTACADEVKALKEEVVALKVAVRPVVEWWRIFKVEFPGHLGGVIDAQLDALAALAALVGEDGR